MTNTLHRFGDAESFHDDYIVFAIPSKSNKDLMRCRNSTAFWKLRWSISR